MVGVEESDEQRYVVYWKGCTACRNSIVASLVIYRYHGDHSFWVPTNPESLEHLLSGSNLECSWLGTSEGA